jgi:hypothetical protein
MLSCYEGWDKTSIVYMAYISLTLARVSSLHKTIFIIPIGVGVFVISYGNSIGIACLCPEGVPCDCFDYAAWVAKIFGTILLATVAGLWIFQRYRKVEIADKFC